MYWLCLMYSCNRIFIFNGRRLCSTDTDTLLRREQSHGRSDALCRTVHRGPLDAADRSPCLSWDEDRAKRGFVLIRTQSAPLPPAKTGAQKASLSESWMTRGDMSRSEERHVGKECRSRW